MKSWISQQLLQRVPNRLSGGMFSLKNLQRREAWLRLGSTEVMYCSCYETSHHMRRQLWLLRWLLLLFLLSAPCSHQAIAPTQINHESGVQWSRKGCNDSLWACTPNTTHTVTHTISIFPCEQQCHFDLHRTRGKKNVHFALRWSWQNLSATPPVSNDLI